MFLSAGTLDGRRDRWKTGPSPPQNSLNMVFIVKAGRNVV
jgi:hypothetical protein